MTMMIRAVWLGALCLLLAGCSTWDVSVTARTAIEQLLLSTAADRALRTRNLVAENQKIFLDTQYLEAYDKQYVVSAIRERLSLKGQLVDTAKEADVIIEPRSGGLAIDKSEFLIGFPSLPLPIPLAGGAVLATPELPLFKYTTRRARAKLAMFALSAKSRKQLAATGTQYSEAYHTNWIILWIPFSTSDIWREIPEDQK